LKPQWIISVREYYLFSKSYDSVGGGNYMKKRSLDETVLQYLDMNEGSETKNKIIDEKFTKYLDDKEELITPVINRILQKIKDSGEDRQVKLDGILEIILLVLQYY
jgi:hypothetical protein